MSYSSFLHDSVSREIFPFADAQSFELIMSVSHMWLNLNLIKLPKHIVIGSIYVVSSRMMRAVMNQPHQRVLNLTSFGVSMTGLPHQM